AEDVAADQLFTLAPASRCSPRATLRAALATAAREVLRLNST
ncbi:transcriptional regulator, partial [Rhodococcus hoagii]|nr:transcriptional regulator [Prescottella equi]